MENKLILSSKVLNKKYVGKCFFRITVFVILCISFLMFYLNGSLPEYIKFSENGNVDYKVFLEENDFFVNKFLGKDRQYIAELVDYISTDFDYNILLDNNDISYRYDYKIEIEASVIDKESKNVIFTKRKDVISKQDLISTDGISIKENVKVDYSYYNDLVKELINTYGLMESAKSSLVAKLYVDYECELDELKNSVKNDVVLKMEMPLAERTLNVSVDNDVYKLKNDFFVFTSAKNNVGFIIGAIIFGCLAIYLVYVLIKYLIDINNYGSSFDKKLNKILKNYESYIQKAEGRFDFKNYKILLVNEFESMLELRDMLSKPIMMIEDDVEGIVRFVITANDIAYIYQLIK